jgi:hypothetical protein
MKPRTVKTRELQPADTVVQEPNGGNPWGACIVTQVTDEVVKLFRPYGHTADFSYTGGVIPFIGVEQYEVELDRDITWILYDRKELK